MTKGGYTSIHPACLPASLLLSHTHNSQVSHVMHPDAGNAPPVIRFWDVFWPWVAFYLSLSLLQGGMGSGGAGGLLNNLRQYLWIPVGQQAYRYLSRVVGRVGCCSALPRDVGQNTWHQSTYTYDANWHDTRRC